MTIDILAYCDACVRRQIVTSAQTDAFHLQQLLSNMAHRLELAKLDASSVRAAVAAMEHCVAQLQVEAAKDLTALITPHPVEAA